MRYLKCTSEETSSVSQMIYWRRKLHLERKKPPQKTFGAHSMKSYYAVTVFDYYTTMLISEVTQFQMGRAASIWIQLTCPLQG